MIKAMVREANRIYRLWCKNNPEFHGQGRVHIIAHSLGSVMGTFISFLLLVMYSQRQKISNLMSYDEYSVRKSTITSVIWAVGLPLCNWSFKSMTGLSIRSIQDLHHLNSPLPFDQSC